MCAPFVFVYLLTEGWLQWPMCFIVNSEEPKRDEEVARVK